MKLKTLKDIETWQIESLSRIEGGRPIDYDEVKKEAIKWVQYFRKGFRIKMTEGDFMDFHNITEEDLK